MISMNMREKIARALAKAHDYREHDEVGNAPAWRLFENDADAVLDALMEPTEGMVEAGHTDFGGGNYYDMIQAARDGK